MVEPITVALYRSLRPKLSPETVTELRVLISERKQPTSFEGWIDTLANLECIEPKTMRVIVLSAISDWCGGEQRDGDFITGLSLGLVTLDHRLATWGALGISKVALVNALRSSTRSHRAIEVVRKRMCGKSNIDEHIKALRDSLECMLAYSKQKDLSSYFAALAVHHAMSSCDQSKGDAQYYVGMTIKSAIQVVTLDTVREALCEAVLTLPELT